MSIILPEQFADLRPTTTTTKTAQNAKPFLFQIRKPRTETVIFCPYFAEVTKPTVENSPLSWIKLTSSLQTRYEFVTCSLQSRGVYVSLLLYLASQGNARTPTNTRFLSKVLFCDERSLKKSLAELEKLKLITLEEKRTELEISFEERSKAQEALRKKSVRKRQGKTSVCESCDNRGVIFDPEFNSEIKCFNC